MFSRMKCSSTALVNCLATLTIIAALSGSANGAGAPAFKVLAFYNGTWDGGHISFVNETKKKFPQIALDNGFECELTNNWGRISSITVEQYPVIMFLDDRCSDRTAFENYMKNGGGWIGFHSCAFNTGGDSNRWTWYYDTFLATGPFRTNTWWPTTAKLACENTDHPILQGLPAKFETTKCEWYGWNKDLRTNPDITILASIDPSSFPLGTDPNQSWYSGYFPIAWVNDNYKALYVNWGHNDVEYNNGNIDHPVTWDNEYTTKIIINAIQWMATGNPTPVKHPASAVTTAVPQQLHVDQQFSTVSIGTKDAGVINVSVFDLQGRALYSGRSVRGQIMIDKSAIGSGTRLFRCELSDRIETITVGIE